MRAGVDNRKFVYYSNSHVRGTQDTGEKIGTPCTFKVAAGFDVQVSTRACLVHLSLSHMFLTSFCSSYNWDDGGWVERVQGKVEPCRGPERMMYVAA